MSPPTPFVAALAKVSEAHPELEADLEVLRLTIAAGDDVVVGTDAPESARTRIKVW